jgi:hypothetical protein
MAQEDSVSCNPKLPVTVLGPEPLKGRNCGGCILALHNRGTSIIVWFHVIVGDQGSGDF